MEQQDPKGSNGNYVQPVRRFKGVDYYQLPSDFYEASNAEMSTEQALIDYFYSPCQDIGILRHCMDSKKMSSSTYKDKTGLLATHPMRAFKLLHLHDSIEVMEQCGNWNGGPLPRSEERWELLEGVESVEQSKLEELLHLKFKAAQEHNETITLKLFAAIERTGFQNQFGESMKRLPVTLQWLEFLRKIGEGIIEISVDKHYIGGKEGVKLTQRQAAYLLAYQNAGILDPRSDLDKKADNFAVTLCGLSSATSGQQLYNKFDKLRRAKDRESAFNSEVDKYRESDTKSPKAMKAILDDVNAIVPLLKGKGKTEAETDLSKWNRMYLDTVR